MTPRRALTMLLLAGCASLMACGGIPRDALRLSEVSLERRQLQTRRFEMADRNRMLAAVSHLLQDLGFNLDSSEVALGVVTASKDRTAKDTGEIFGTVMLSMLLLQDPVYDVRQRLRASVVVSPVGAQGKSLTVRVTFQRTVWNNRDRISRNEGLFDPKHYQEFFTKLSNAVFLEAHDT